MKLVNECKLFNEMMPLLRQEAYDLAKRRVDLKRILIAQEKKKASKAEDIKALLGELDNLMDRMGMFSD